MAPRRAISPKRRREKAAVSSAVRGVSMSMLPTPRSRTAFRSGESGAPMSGANSPDQAFSQASVRGVWGEAGNPQARRNRAKAYRGGTSRSRPNSSQIASFEIAR